MILANSVSVSCGIPMTIPYVAICAVFGCISSMLTLTFLQKSKLWLISLSSYSNTLFVDGWLVPLIANFSTSYIVNASMLLWSLPPAILRMALVTSLLANLVIALTAPSLVQMTN